MIFDKEYLIPIINNEIRNGTKRFDVYEGWRRRKPLFFGEYSNGKINVNSLNRKDYMAQFPEDREFASYFDLIQKVCHASGMIEEDQIEPYRERFISMTEDEEPFKRNIRFYYDTNSLMNNYFQIFREFISDFTRKAGHTTSYGVSAELEDLLDRKLKGHHFPRDFKDFYGREDDIFYNQPNLVGRFSRMAYGELDYMKDELRSNLITDNRTGDRNIMNAFLEDSQEYSLEGMMVTNDAVMAERAEKRMGVWHVKFDIEPLTDLQTRLEYFINAIYRASIVYGRVQINKNIIIDGLWKGKRTEDWNDKRFYAMECGNCDIKKVQNILKDIPEEFYGMGYYHS